MNHKPQPRAINPAGGLTIDNDMLTDGRSALASWATYTPTTCKRSGVRLLYQLNLETSKITIMHLFSR